METLKLLQIASVKACGTGAVATISILGVPVDPPDRCVCRLMLKWRRLLAIASDRPVKCILLLKSVRAFIIILIRFSLRPSSSLCSVPECTLFASKVTCILHGRRHRLSALKRRVVKTLAGITT